MARYLFFLGAACVGCALIAELVDGDDLAFWALLIKADIYILAALIMCSHEAA